MNRTNIPLEVRAKMSVYSEEEKTAFKALQKWPRKVKYAEKLKLRLQLKNLTRKSKK